MRHIESFTLHNYLLASTDIHNESDSAGYVRELAATWRGTVFDILADANISQLHQIDIVRCSHTVDDAVLREFVVAMIRGLFAMQVSWVSPALNVIEQFNAGKLDSYAMTAERVRLKRLYDDRKKEIKNDDHMSLLVIKATILATYNDIDVSMQYAIATFLQSRVGFVRAYLARGLERVLRAHYSNQSPIIATWYTTPRRSFDLPQPRSHSVCDNSIESGITISREHRG